MRGPAPTMCARRIEVSDIARWNSSITVASLKAPATASSMLNIDRAPRIDRSSPAAIRPSSCAKPVQPR